MTTQADEKKKQFEDLSLSLQVDHKGKQKIYTACGNPEQQVVELKDTAEPAQFINLPVRAIRDLVIELMASGLLDLDAILHNIPSRLLDESSCLRPGVQTDQVGKWIQLIEESLNPMVPISDDMEKMAKEAKRVSRDTAVMLKHEMSTKITNLDVEWRERQHRKFRS